jgi:Xaa-Pro aminopeptidase
MNRAGLAEGAEYAWTWMVAGNPPDRGRGRREENLRPIAPGDCVVAGIYLVYAGYYGHTLRTLSIGEPSEDMLRVRRAVSDAQQAAAGLLKPGISARIPPATADETLFRHFPEVREGDRLRFRTCHFIGLDYSESPTAKTIAQPPAWSCVGNLAADLVDLPLEAGMTMEIHPNTRPPGFGFAAVGDVFVVTPDGGQSLTTFPRDLQVISPG